LWFSVTNLVCSFNLLAILEGGIDHDDNQDERLHRNINFARDRIVNVDDVGDDEPNRLKIPLSQTGKYPHQQCGVQL
jgi:hypothetical protein